MNTTKGFLYGHYDSRGGTMFVVAKDRAAADFLYATAAGWGDALERSEWQGMVDQDFIREVNLHHAKPLPEYGDLENGDYNFETKESSGGGHVIVGGKKKQWPPVSEEDEAQEEMTEDEQNGCNFFDGNSSDLEWVEEGDKPTFFTNGYSWPRWDDDAFAFVVVTEERAAKMAGN